LLVNKRRHTDAGRRVTAYTYERRDGAGQGVAEKPTRKVTRTKNKIAACVTRTAASAGSHVGPRRLLGLRTEQWFKVLFDDATMETPACSRARSSSSSSSSSYARRVYTDSVGPRVCVSGIIFFFFSVFIFPGRRRTFINLFIYVDGGRENM